MAKRMRTHCLLLVLLVSSVMLSLHLAAAQDQDLLPLSSSFGALQEEQKAIIGAEGDVNAVPAMVEPVTDADTIEIMVHPTRPISQRKATRMAATLQEAVAERAAAVATADDGPTAPDVDALGMGGLYQAIFDRHNSYRARHQAGGLTWSDTLASQAASYAAQCNFAHDPYSNAGENLFATSDTSNPSGALTQAIDVWYDEVRMYSFSNPGFSSSTGHFTQVVWRATTAVGCAVQTCNNGMGGTGWARGTLVVCRYSPTGNVLGQFQQNVLPATANPPPPPANPPPANPPPTKPPAPQVPPGTLPAGYKFASPGCLSSAGGNARLCMQDTGYVVLYRGNPGNSIWVSPNSMVTSFKPYKLTMQKDGNLIASDNLNRVLWQSRTSGQGVAPHRMVVQDDGNVVVIDATNSWLWATNTAAGRK